MSNPAVIGLDIAKNVFQVHGADIEKVRSPAATSPIGGLYVLCSIAQGSHRH